MSTIPLFPTTPSAIKERLQSIQPIAYGKSRNFINGSVTYLSPYISRGILNTNDVFTYLQLQQYPWSDIEVLVKELAWRDFFQHTWNHLHEKINYDIHQEQLNIAHHSIPKNIIDGTTGIQAIDESIKQLYATGYMHNHCRMYIASITCNIAKTHWLEPAHWMYYYLLDADWASNACSWQWVAGSFSTKRYYANQENINRYCGSKQIHTFLDKSYEELPFIDIPEQLNERIEHTLTTKYPESVGLERINTSIPTLLYNWYNLDYSWHNDLEANRVLIIEPSVFSHYPICDASMNFMLDLTLNIPNLIIFQGEFSELQTLLKESECIFKQHPLQLYKGREEQRDMMIQSSGYYRGFFSFWKNHEKELKKRYEG